MTTLNAEQVESIRNYCQLSDLEWCGVLEAKGTVRPMNNVSKTPKTAWEFDPEEWSKVRENVVALIHSHVVQGMVDIRTPSVADIKCHEAFKLPLFIVGMYRGIFYAPIRIPSIPTPTYLGRKYIAAVNDCSTLLRDFYHFEMGIKINCDMEKSLCVVKEQSANIRWGLERNGFVEGEVEALRKGDVLLVSMGAKGNHGVIVEDDTWGLNQGLVSERVLLSDVIHHAVGGVFRHKSMI